MPGPSNSGYAPERRSNFSDLYSADYIGLMSNLMFKKFLDSTEAPEDKRALLSMRKSWFDLKKNRYGPRGDKAIQDEAVKSIQSLGGSAVASKPGFLNAAKRLFTGSGYDGREAKEIFRTLQADREERSLETYNDLVGKAVGARGKFDESTGAILPVSSDVANGYRMNETENFASDLIQYHYNDNGSGNPDTFSQYQRNLLEAAKRNIQMSGANGMFTSAYKENWHDYNGVSLAELGISPERLGKMANAYNQYITELYMSLSSDLHYLGARLPNDGSGVSVEKLQDMVSQALNYKALTSRGKTSRGSSATQERIREHLSEWLEYKQAMEHVKRYSSQLTGLDKAEFVVSYCGGRDEEGVAKYWPWWEPDQAGAKSLYLDCLDMLDNWDLRNETYEKEKAAGNIAARRPDRSDYDPENQPEFDGRAFPTANGPVHGAGGARGMPAQGAGEADWIGI